MPELLDYLKGDSITLSGDPNNEVTFDPGLYNNSTLGPNAGSKGISFIPFSQTGTGNGPILGNRVTFSANENADPTFTYGNGYDRSSIDQFVRGGEKYALDARTTDFKRLSKFIFETAQGQNFILKESALQLLNPFKPKLINLGAGLLGGDIVRGATNMMTQVLGAGVTNVKRGGLLPNLLGDLAGDSTYSGDYKNIGADRENKYGLGSPGGPTSKKAFDKLIDIANPFAKGQDSDTATSLDATKKIYNVPIDDSYLKVDKVNMLGIYNMIGGEFEDDTKLKDFEGSNDFIPFKFEVIDHQNPLKTKLIQFRAFLDSFGDDYNASYNEVKYNGRPEKFYTYSEFERSISVGFKIAAQTRHELKPLYRKLNYLASQTAPGFFGGRMITPYIRLTVGDWCKRIPGIIPSVGLAWNQDYSWEIKAGTDNDDDVLMLPHVLDVSVQFTPFHDFVPSSMLGESWFIGGKNDLNL